MTLLYLRYRVLMAWSALKPGGRKDWGFRIVIGIVCLVNLPVLGLFYWGLRRLFAAVAEAHGLDRLQQLLHLPAAAYGLFLLFLVLNRVHPTLFEATDDALLRSLPIPPRSLAHARLTVLAVSLSPLLLLFMPLAVFYGLEAGASVLYYPTAAIPLYGLFLLSIGALLTCLLALSLSSRLLRIVSRVGSAVILIPAGLAAVTMMPMAHKALAMIDALLSLAEQVSVGPIAWLVTGLAGAATGAVGQATGYLVTLAVSAALLWLASVWITARLPPADVIDAEPADVGTASGLSWWAPSWLSGPSRGLWRRELIAVREEAARTLLLPMGMILLFTVMNRIMSDAFPMRLMLGILSVSIVAGQTMVAVGQEGKAFWILRMLPVPMWRILLVKLVVRLLVALLALATAAALVVGIGSLGKDASSLATSPFAFNLDINAALLPWLAVMAMIALVLCGVWGLAIGARFPEFIPTRKGQYVGVGPNLLGTFGSMFIIASLLLSLLPLQVEALLPILWFLPFAVIAFWIALTTLFFAWSAWHLERLEA